MPTNIVLTLLLALGVGALLYMRRKHGATAKEGSAKEREPGAGVRGFSLPSLRRPAASSPRPPRTRPKLIPHDAAVPPPPATEAQDAVDVKGGGIPDPAPTQVVIPAVPVAVTEIDNATPIEAVAVEAPGWPVPGELAGGLSFEEFDPHPDEHEPAEAQAPEEQDTVAEWVEDHVAKHADEDVADWARSWEESTTAQQQEEAVAVMTDASAPTGREEDESATGWTGEPDPDSDETGADEQTYSSDLTAWSEADAGAADEVAIYVWETPVEDPGVANGEASYTVEWPAAETDEEEPGEEPISGDEWDVAAEEPTPAAERVQVEEPATFEWEPAEADDMEKERVSNTSAERATVATSPDGQGPATADAAWMSEWMEELAAVRALAESMPATVSEARTTLTAAADANAPVIVVMPPAPAAPGGDLAASVRRLEAKVVELAADGTPARRRSGGTSATAPSAKKAKKSGKDAKRAKSKKAAASKAAKKTDAKKAKAPAKPDEKRKSKRRR